MKTYLNTQSPCVLEYGKKTSAVAAKDNEEDEGQTRELAILCLIF